MGAPEKTRGKVIAAHNDRLAALREGITIEHFSWGHVDMEKIRMLLFAATVSEAAVMFSPADGGEGVCVTLFAGGSKVKLFAQHAAKLHIICSKYVAGLGVDEDLALQAVELVDRLVALPAD